MYRIANTWQRWLLALVLASLAACDSGGSAGGGPRLTGVVEGSVIYRERMKLPPGAELSVELQDISRADAPAATLASTVVPSPQGPPFAFRLDYPVEQVEPKHRYALRATISHGGRILFTNTEYIDPFAGGGEPLEILVQRVPGESGGPD